MFTELAATNFTIVGHHCYKTTILGVWLVCTCLGEITRRVNLGKPQCASLRIGQQNVLKDVFEEFSPFFQVSLLCHPVVEVLI